MVPTWNRRMWRIVGRVVHVKKYIRRRVMFPHHGGQLAFSLLTHSYSCQWSYVSLYLSNLVQNLKHGFGQNMCHIIITWYNNKICNLTICWWSRFLFLDPWPWEVLLLLSVHFFSPTLLTWTPKIPKIMKKAQQMTTMLPMGFSDDIRVSTTSFRPGALLITLEHKHWRTHYWITCKSVCVCVCIICSRDGDEMPAVFQPLHTPSLHHVDTLFELSSLLHIWEFFKSNK